MGIVQLILAFLPIAIQSIPTISQEVKQIIADITSSAGKVIGSGAIKNPTPSTILVALAGVIQVLKGEPNLPQPTLDLLAALDRAAQAGLLADQEAQQKVDPTTLKPIDPLP